MQGKMVAVLICLDRGTENLREPVWLIWECERYLRWFGVNVRNCWLPLESRWSGKRRRAKRLQPSKSVLYHLAHLCLESMSSNPLREFMPHNRPRIASATFFVLSLRSPAGPTHEGHPFSHGQALMSSRVRSSRRFEIR